MSSSIEIEVFTRKNKRIRNSAIWLVKKNAIQLRSDGSTKKVELSSTLVGNGTTRDLHPTGQQNNDLRMLTWFLISYRSRSYAKYVEVEINLNSYNLKFCPDVFYYIPVPKRAPISYLEFFWKMFFTAGLV